MQQTAFMGVNNILKRLPYLGGLCKFWFIPVQEVASIPGIDPLNQYLLAEPVLKAGKVWRGPVPVPDAQKGISEPQKNDDRGTYYEIKLSAQAPGDAPQSRVNFDNMVYCKYLVVGKLRAGGFYILLGSLDSPLDFDNNYSNGPGAAENALTKIAFSGESLCRALVLPSFNGDDSGFFYPVGSGSTGVVANNTEIIYINDEDTKTITWTTARFNRFGAFPEVEVYLRDGGGTYYKSATQPYIDEPPPDFTTMSFDFGGNVTGFISIK